LTELTTEEGSISEANVEKNVSRKLKKSLLAAASNDAPSLEKEADKEDIADFLEQFEDVVTKYQLSL
jgi:hypothetical protein